jgi:hypothetical protein
VEDLVVDRYKDHCTKTYHFSMLKRVNKGFGPDEIVIELNNEKLFYEAMVPGQRDFIVAMIMTALDESTMYLKNNKGVNCPENHNMPPNVDARPLLKHKQDAN